LYILSAISWSRVSAIRLLSWSIPAGLETVGVNASFFSVLGITIDLAVVYTGHGIKTEKDEINKKIINITDNFEVLIFIPLSLARLLRIKVAYK
jgi:hypothetical protein